MHINLTSKILLTAAISAISAPVLAQEANQEASEQTAEQAATAMAPSTYENTQGDIAPAISSEVPEIEAESDTGAETPPEAQPEIMSGAEHEDVAKSTDGNSVLNESDESAEIAETEPLKELGPDDFALADDREFPVRLINEMSSRHAAQGDSFQFEVTQNIYENGEVIVPLGTQGSGTVVMRQKRGSFGKPGILHLQFDHLVMNDGNRHDLGTVLVQEGQKTHIFSSEQTINNLVQTGQVLAGLPGVGLVSAGVAAVGFLVKGKRAEISTDTILSIRLPETGESDEGLASESGTIPDVAEMLQEETGQADAAEPALGEIVAQSNPTDDVDAISTEGVAKGPADNAAEATVEAVEAVEDIVDVEAIKDVTEATAGS